MTPCIAYIRYSSDGQKDGSSDERQTEAIDLCLQRNGLQPVETFKDEGFSASKGKHLSHGALGRILTDVDAGKYRGHALVVEKMDRFSRMGIDETRQLTRRLIQGGMELHLAANGRIVRSLDDLTTVIMDAVESYGAQQYSANLKMHVRKGKEERKDQAVTEGWILSRKVPWWLQVVGRENIGNKITKPGTIVEIPERVAVVREVFRLAALGVGVQHIAHKLNGSALSLSWITRTLYDRSVLGEFRPAGREPIGGRSLCDGNRTDLRSGGNSETFCRRVPRNGTSAAISTRAISISLTL